jgi:hypothetical protein
MDLTVKGIITIRNSTMEPDAANDPIIDSGKPKNLLELACCELLVLARFRLDNPALSEVVVKSPKAVLVAADAGMLQTADWRRRSFALFLWPSRAERVDHGVIMGGGWLRGGLPVGIIAVCVELGMCVG